VDFNVVVLAGRLAAEPELREFDSGARLIRYLITVRSEEPRRRVDVLPVTLWDPPQDLIAAGPTRGQAIWAACSAQRRFWEGEKGRRSTVEIVAHHIDLRRPDEEEGGDQG
jgi:single-stranded DNA-binding protein